MQPHTLLRWPRQTRLPRHHTKARSGIHRCSCHDPRRLHIQSQVREAGTAAAGALEADLVKVGSAEGLVEAN
jgi:hypothetical protein